MSGRKAAFVSTGVASSFAEPVFLTPFNGAQHIKATLAEPSNVMFGVRELKRAPPLG